MHFNPDGHFKALSTRLSVVLQALGYVTGKLEAQHFLISNLGNFNSEDVLREMTKSVSEVAAHLIRADLYWVVRARDVLPLPPSAANLKDVKAMMRATSETDLVESTTLRLAGDFYLTEYFKAILSTYKDVLRVNLSAHGVRDLGQPVCTPTLNLCQSANQDPRNVG